MTIFPTTETKLTLQGPAGSLETVITPIATDNKIAIVCHPHPLYGGTMNNKVVTTTARAFNQLGISTIRFNYRGVGESEGSFGHLVGETEDLLAIITWVQETLPNAQFWLAGFSFGAYIAAQGALKLGKEVRQLISIAPAVNHGDFDPFANLECPWLVIQGEEDEVVPPSAVYAWVDRLQSKTTIKLIRVPEASHFFHGKLIALRDIIVSECVR